MLKNSKSVPVKIDPGKTLNINPSLALDEEEQEKLKEETLVCDTHIVPVLKNSKSVPVEVESGKILNINPSIAPDEQERLITLLKT